MPVAFLSTMSDIVNAKIIEHDVSEMFMVAGKSHFI